MARSEYRKRKDRQSAEGVRLKREVERLINLYSILQGDSISASYFVRDLKKILKGES